MTLDQAKIIQHLLMKRVQPSDAEEGVAIAKLAGNLVAHFVPQTSASPAAASTPPSPGST